MANFYSSLWNFSTVTSPFFFMMFHVLPCFAHVHMVKSFYWNLVKLILLLLQKPRLFLVSIKHRRCFDQVWRHKLSTGPRLWSSGSLVNVTPQVRRESATKWLGFSEASYESSLKKGDQQLSNLRPFNGEIAGKPSHFGSIVFRDWKRMDSSNFGISFTMSAGEIKQER